MSGVKTNRNNATHDNDMSRVSNDAILTHLIDESATPHTREEQEKIQNAIRERILTLTQTHQEEV